MAGRIVVDPDVMVGKPVIKGTRVTVETILRQFAKGAVITEILNDFPQLSKQDIEAALDYSAKIIANEEVHLISVGKRAKVSGG